MQLCKVLFAFRTRYVAHSRYTPLMLWYREPVTITSCVAVLCTAVCNRYHITCCSTMHRCMQPLSHHVLHHYAPLYATAITSRVAVLCTAVCNRYHITCCSTMPWVGGRCVRGWGVGADVWVRQSGKGQG